MHWSEGTSASTPIVSAMISLLNDARVQSGKSTLGFLNPMLYKMYADNPNTFTGKSSRQARHMVTVVVIFDHLLMYPQTSLLATIDARADPLAVNTDTAPHLVGTQW